MLTNSLNRKRDIKNEEQSLWGGRNLGRGGEEILCSVCRSCHSSKTNLGCFHSCKCKLMHYLQDMSKASREALQSISLLKYRKFFENT